MKFSHHFLVVVCLAKLVWAEPPILASEFAWPSFIERIRLRSVPVYCSWKEGRPYVSREHVSKLLKLPAEGSVQLDLIEALSQAGWTVQMQSDGSLVANPPLHEIHGPNTSLAGPIRETDESRLAVSRFSRICSQENKVWVKHHPRQQWVDEVGANLARQARRPIPWTFAIIQDREPNAACTGEGMVFITTALVELLDQDELAGVLGHEVAHGVLQQLPQDSQEKARRRQTLNQHEAAEARLRTAEAKARREYEEDLRRGSSPEHARNRYDSAVESANSSYKFSTRNTKDKIKGHQSHEQFSSQTNERQADLMGLRLAASAGYRPDGLLRALEKLEAANFTHYGQSKMLGAPTHPPIRERIRALRQILSHWQQ